MPVIQFNIPDVQNAIVIGVIGPMRSGKHLIVSKIAQWLQHQYGIRASVESGAPANDVDESALKRVLSTHPIILMEQDVRNERVSRPSYLSGKIDTADQLRMMGGYGKVVG